MKSSEHSLTTGQVAKACDVSQRTVINWINKGILQAYTLPGRGDRRVLASVLEDFMRERGMLPRPPNPLDDNSSKVNRKILIVDDDPMMLNALYRNLKSRGYSASTAADGFEAGRQLEREQPTLVILDLQMPKIDGFQVLKIIRQEFTGTRVIVISGAGDELLERAHQEGADAVLAKPFDEHELQEKIEELLPT